MLQKNSSRLLLALIILILPALACQVLTGDGSEEPTAVIVEPTSLPTEAIPTEAIPTEVQPTSPPQETAPPPQPTEPETYDSPFPLPSDVQNFSMLTAEQINYQTSFSMDEVIAFYRAEFSAQGLSERGILTVIEENAFSMVFDGSPNGKSIVLQGFPLDENTTNVNLRYEEI